MFEQSSRQLFHAQASTSVESASPVPSSWLTTMLTDSGKRRRSRFGGLTLSEDPRLEKPRPCMCTCAYSGWLPSIFSCTYQSCWSNIPLQGLQGRRGWLASCWASPILTADSATLSLNNVKYLPKYTIYMNFPTFNKTPYPI